MIRGVWGEGHMVEKKDIEVVDSEQEPEAPKGNPKPQGKTQKEIDEVEEQLAKMELKQRKYEGAEEGHE